MRTTISELRARARMTQAALAEAAGITRPYLSQIENGERNLSLALQKRLADALGCDPRDLVDFEAGPGSDEEVILQAYRSMPKDWQKVIVDMARRILK
ncbi:MULTISPECIES: helix-turn-helix transcriptional regulator [Marivita]|uniref:Helix-turn-helix transcriptional regulator n=1 Tax=Marivita cryptomonadis TaxID=505252 RepID=A0A9Q2RYA5_9RHOB|nr:MULTISPECIES: helix-turn-helix transcriptional regulator [Marivita]MCR9170082.1 helix-turn-helix domain-containing protein [Paracoccaceae bacterium]MBM2322682.1 helix-turn-helix transcriptional regulator [Marivita cryptomonadis]MBM2332264.1 helix-turn-helix transcriptional regulator [Marivita cryptomonadis]MBM2341848.1 helix-turn-helix transcriptional regulator [Marivita cryptomonadis]MBM2346512.1 helix-turn-helix transcriptional regulator [Marivita cryptomonadis]